MKSKSPKKNLLFLNYLEGIPNPNIGGPNNVIYNFLANFGSEDIEFDFLSYGAFVQNINSLNVHTADQFLFGTKKFTSGVYYRNNLFRRIVSNDFYKPFHFWKHNHFFLNNFPQKQYNLIHAHDSVGLAFTNHLKNCKRIMTVHHYIPYSLDMSNPIKNSFIKSRVFDQLRKQERLSLQLCDIITFPSHAVKNYFFSEMQDDVTKDVRIIYNGVDIRKIHSIAPYDLRKLLPQNDHEFDLVIVSAASHEKYKNIDVALKTIAEIINIHKKNVVFVNCGIGSETENLKGLVRKLGINKNVVFLGAIPNHEVISLMKASDVFLHLSDKVVFDLVVLEAMACGLFVVVSNSGGNREIIRNDFNGFLVDKLEPEAVADIIIKKSFPFIRKNALDTVKQFSLENYVSEYSKVYLEP